jgi:hypothetical protein
MISSSVAFPGFLSLVSAHYKIQDGKFYKMFFSFSMMISCLSQPSNE